MSDGRGLAPSLQRFFELRSRRRVIEGCIRRLAPHLRSDYQHGAPYTPEQVAATLARRPVLSAAQTLFAPAIFCAAEALDDAATALRRQVADLCFDGIEFRPVAIDRYFRRLRPSPGGDDYSWGGPEPDGWSGGHGSGHDGGGHGGGH